MPEVTLQQAFDLAIQHHQAGRLGDAESLYRQILAVDARHSGCLHYLGVIAHQVGRNELAVELIRQSLSLQPNDPGAHSNLGNALHSLGQLDEAIAAYRQAVILQPNYPEAHNNLGNALRGKGQLEEAISACRRALALRPAYPDALNNLGAALYDKGQAEEAMAAYRQAIALRPDFAEAYNNLGFALRGKGRLDEAIAAFRQATALRPNFPAAIFNLGNALGDRGQLDEAISAYRQAIVLQPAYPEAHSNLGTTLNKKGLLDEAIAALRQAIVLRPDLAETHFNLGNVLWHKSQLEEAIAAYRQAIALRPDLAEAHFNLGNVLWNKWHLKEAIAAYRQAIALRPDFPSAYCNLGNALQDASQLDEAIATYRHALSLQPDFPEADNSLGNALKDKGYLDEAISAFRSALQRKPGMAAAHSNLLYILHFHPGFDARAIAEEHRRWNDSHAESLRQLSRPHANDRDPERRLRVGYVSPDFRDHVVGRNMLPLFAHHAHEHFEVFCYAENVRSDEITGRFRESADHWRSTVGLGDETLAALIREDRIDILVDLALHMAGNRLPLFARKPAPIQVTFAGYPGSTGLSTIDYRLSDPYLDPAGTDESLYAEKTVRLPHSFWCYDPFDCCDIPINTLPAQANGFVTFGCLNNFCKINDKVLRLWAGVLRAVAGSRLLMLAPEGSHRQRALELLRQEGIASERVEFFVPRPRRQYLELYQRIDLGLDTLPYNGHTTSLDSFWMGVPVVTLVGETVVGRAGLCQLMNLGLPELVAHTGEDYVRIAAELAGDLPRLAELRATLRARMQASPLMDAPAFARDIEAAYRTMWRTWCEQPQSPSCPK